MLNVEPAGKSMGSIARGGADGWLTAMTRFLTQYDQVTYLRPWSEMNNPVNPYTPYHPSGTHRGPPSTPRRPQHARATGPYSLIRLRAPSGQIRTTGASPSRPR